MKRLVLALGIVVATLALPTAAWAHAALLKTVPSASVTANTPPKTLLLVYSEEVEPRFAIVSVTDAGAHQETAAAPFRSPADPGALVVPLKHLSEGWYLVYWRVVSEDGHPVRGAFTFAVGPKPGRPPQFVIPSSSETAATPQLVVLRWLTFLSFMTAIGLYVLRMLIVRPVVRRVGGTSFRPLSVAFAVAALVSLVMTPLYVIVATAQFALRSAFDLGAIVPLVDVSAFGRGYLYLELCLALFAIAALASFWVDRPDRAHRSLAELLALAGALLAAGAALLVPGLVGHAAQTSPRAWSLVFDWTHLAAGSVWIGGLIGLLAFWRSLPAAGRVAALAVCVPRFSSAAFVSVLVLIASGTAATIVHLPTLASLWQTSYGQTILVKIALLAGALLLAAVNLLRLKPRLEASSAQPELGPPTALLLRRFVSVEVAIVAAAICAAALLSSLAPPASALAEIGHAAARVGPGPVATTIERNGYTLQVSLLPNKAAVPNEFTLQLTRSGKPVTGARITTTLAMLDMEMEQQAYTLREVAPGVYRRSAPALAMVGRWGVGFQIDPRGAQPFQILIVDRANG
ncbi:MAG: copper resistance CopC/CopD family protein [Gaiellaceae bacterium]